MALIECPLRKMARTSPEATVMQINERCVSARQLDAWVENYRILLRTELDEGDRLLVILKDKAAAVVVILACLRSKLIYSPVNPSFPVTQIEQYAERIGASCYVCDTGSGFEGVSRLEAPSLSGTGKTVSEPLAIESSAIFDLIPTSGTTGLPKAVAHSFDNHHFSAKGSSAVIALGAGDGWLMSLPLFHVGGFSIVIRCLLAGAAMVIDQQQMSLAEQLIRLPVTHVSVVNAQLFRLLQDERVQLSDTRLKYILLGGGVASAPLVRTVQDAGVCLLTTYGMTEMSSQVCTGEPCFSDTGVTSGAVLPYRRVRIASDGEILVAGEPLCLGYYQNGTALPVTDEQGWYHSGDLGEWSGDQIRILGRKDNMFISGGENIHPEEVEQALLACDGVAQAVVVAVQNREYGQRPVAFVEMKHGDVNETFIKRLLKSRVAGFKIPDRIVPMPKELPVAFSGQALFTGIKPNRSLLQKLASQYIA